MSDPEPSVVAITSSPPSTQASDSTASSYAFLVHSQKTLTQNLPPRVDNKLLARQKRRRTSPEDHAVLEAEYQRNPKPDKTSRANIVSRVSLGEKEVQIWFQNRRQNDRRKSKPLQPHELLPSSQSDDLKNTDEGISEPVSSGVEQDNRDVQPEGDSFASGADKDDDNLELSQTSIATSEFPEPSQADDVVELDAVHPDASNDLQNSAKRKRSGSDSGRNAEAALDTFKSPPSLRLSMSFDGEAMVRKEGEMTPSPPKGRNSLRISMSADGQAVIRANGEPSPSKNRISMFSARKPRATGLRRSSSAVVLGTPTSLQKERSFGRSRDPRNWESLFDTDARSALSTPFSSQSTPNSAALRSTGPRSLTRSVSAKHSLLTPEHQSTPITQAMREKRRKLSRTVSSLGRLESGRKVLGEKAPSTLKNSKTPKDDLDLDGDSDKENWVPGTRVAQSRRRTVSHNQRPVLKDANGRDGRPNSKAPRSRLSQPLHRKANGGSKSMSGLSNDVSAFMGENTASQEEDLDCIQGLLSLSQGAWR